MADADRDGAQIQTQIESTLPMGVPLDEAEQMVKDMVRAIEKEEQEKETQPSGDDHSGHHHTVLMETLQTAAKDGVGTRGPLANQFARCPSGGKSNAYKQCVDRDEKAEFRKRWAAAKFEGLCSIREREDEWRQVDTTKGTMVSIKEVIKKEGAQDATRYIQKCAKLGAPWIQWDPMWERYEVMVMEKSHSDIFAKAWRLKCQRVEESSAVITAGAAPQARAAPQAPPTSAKAVITANQKPRPGKRNMEGDDEGGGGKAAKKQIKVLSPLSLANKTKVSFKSATSSAATLQSVIEHNAERQWASNEHTQRPLHEARAALDQAVASNRFAQIFLTMPYSDIKNKYDDEEISKECGRLSTVFDPLCKTLSVEVSQLVNMHAVRSKRTQ